MCTRRHSGQPRTDLPFLALTLVPVLLIGAGVRLLGIGTSDLWGDEAFSVMTSLGPIDHLLAMLSTGEPHPPLYPFLLAGWLRLFGHSEVVARLPSAFAGIASIPVAVNLARASGWSSGDRRSVLTGILAGLLVALNPIQVWYSQEARMYAQVSFFAGLATLALVRLWQGRRWSGVLYGAAVLGAAGSHYYGLFVPLAHGGVVAWFGRRHRDLLRRWLRVIAIATLLYLPWVIVALHVFTSYYGAQPGTVNLGQVALSGWVRMAAGWALSWPHAVEAAAVVTLLVALGVVVRARSPADDFVRTAVVAWLATPFLAGFAISLVRPMYAERYFVVASLPYSLLAARGIAALLTARLPSCSRLRLSRALARPAAGGVALILSLALSLIPLYNVWIGRYLKSAYNTHMRMVDGLARPGDAVILDGTSQLPLYEYYLHRPYPTYPLPRTLPLDPSATATELAAIARQHTGAWVFLYATPDYDPGYFIPRWLTEHAFRAFDVWEVNGRLQYYRFAPAGGLPVRPASIRFGDVLLLDRFGWLDDRYTAGDSIPVLLAWQWLTPALTAPMISLRLVDEQGFTWAQEDTAIGGDFLPGGQWPVGRVLEDRHGLMIPPGTPPGIYRLVLNVYTADHPLPYPAAGAGAEIGPSGVVLGRVRVVTPSQSLWTGGIAGFQAVQTSFDGRLALLGFAGSRMVRAGESGYLTLFWKALQAGPSATRLEVTLLDSGGRIAEQRDLPLATPSFPPSSWMPGDILREQYHLPVAQGLPSGIYQIAVRPVPGTAAPVRLGPLEVEAGPPAEHPAPPSQAVEYTLGNSILLEGFDLPSAVLQPGAELALTLHWRDLHPVDDDYTVFVHLLDGHEKVVAQRDQPPSGGARPTSSWFPGDVVLDAYRIAIPPGLAPGRYVIEVGMYNPTNGSRLAVVDRAGNSVGDRILLTHVTVRR